MTWSTPMRHLLRAWLGVLVLSAVASAQGWTHRVVSNPVIIDHVRVQTEVQFIHDGVDVEGARKAFSYTSLAELKALIQIQLRLYQGADDLAKAAPKSGEVVDLSPVEPPPPTREEIDRQAFIALLDEYVAKKAAYDAKLLLDEQVVTEAWAAVKAAYQDDYAPILKSRGL